MSRRKILIGVVIIGCTLYGFIYLFIKPAPPKEKAKITEETVSVEAKQERVPKEEFSGIPRITKESSLLPEETSNENKEIKDLIEQLKNEDFLTSQEAAEKLVNKGKEAVPLLLETLPDASVGLKGQTVFILGRIGDSEATFTLMDVLQKDENAYVRRNAAEALGKIKDETAIDVLSVSLFDSDASVRHRTAWALGELRDAKASGDLLNRMTDEKDRGVKIEIVRALGKIKDWEATPLLLDELNSGYNQPYKNEVVIALGEIADREALEGLREYLNHLMKNRPTEEIYIFEWEEAIRIVKKAIRKIEEIQ